ncbi:glycosyltransferase group 1 family [Haloferula helveola]|uniref:Glycosyltransferase group 1 family n=1 Tax=Haloferula helveola TaxID=490095 RepID=A0ABN6H9T4_9BACT|nr:glycosyltransferase group 1 family [Haloferula helveola]
MTEPALVIVHYHLRPGGVWQVIRTTSKALTRAGVPHLILSGETTEYGNDLPIRTVAGLDYSTAAPGEHSTTELVGRLRSAVVDHFGEGPVVWHFHNPCLGKNPTLSSAVGIMAASGEAMILQHHDLAEDGRPENLKALDSMDELYPITPRVIHAFINSRDLRRFIKAGLPAEQGTVLPNPLSPNSPLPPSDSEHPVVFQPVRAIRRKNIGETILLAAAAPQGARFAISRAPDQPRWQTAYREWTQFAAEFELPLDFDVSDRIPAPGTDSRTFNAWLERSTHLLTTSISEGFGLAFIESLALGRPLIGRRLPEIDTDLPDHPTDRLYESLRVPSDWLDTDLLHSQIREALKLAGLPSDPDAIHSALGGDDGVDFGRLSEDMQRAVIRAWLSGRRGITAVDRLGSLPLETWLLLNLENRSAADPNHQLDRYRAEFLAESLAQHATRLLAEAPAPIRHLDRSAVIEQFRNPADFRFLKS